MSDMNHDYSTVPDKLVNEVVGRQYTDEGVRLLKENTVGGVWSCTWKVVEWGEHTDVAPCSACGTLHDAHSPALCHDCRF